MIYKVPEKSELLKVCDSPINSIGPAGQEYYLLQEDGPTIRRQNSG